MFYDILMDTVIDSLKLLPFLFLTYLAMEYLEHKTSDKVNMVLRGAGNCGPVIGGLLGAFPQCGFSAAAANFYAGRVITVGTLVAVFLSTSDEMLPIFISNRVDIMTIVRILSIKVVIGVIAGFVIDVIYQMKHKEDGEIHIHELCEHEHCHCEKGIWRSALSHTGQIFGFIFFMNLALNAVLSLWGVEQLKALAGGASLLAVFVMAIIGLIPNCASSVAITELYLEGIISMGAMMSGLLVGAGVGLLVLFRVNKNMKQNLKITGYLYIVAVVAGLLIDVIN